MTSCLQPFKISKASILVNESFGKQLNWCPKSWLNEALLHCASEKVMNEYCCEPYELQKKRERGRQTNEAAKRSKTLARNSVGIFLRPSSCHPKEEMPIVTWSSVVYFGIPSTLKHLVKDIQTINHTTILSTKRCH